MENKERFINRILQTLTQEFFFYIFTRNTKISRLRKYGGHFKHLLKKKICTFLLVTKNSKALYLVIRTPTKITNTVVISVAF